MSSYNLRFRRNFLVDKEFLRPKNECCSDETPPDPPSTRFSMTTSNFWLYGQLRCRLGSHNSWSED